MKIFSDTLLGDTAFRMLKDGVAPHEVIVPKQLATSVLAKSGPDPAFAEVEIAFGQPDLANFEQPGRLRWLHLSSAGFTRYDTPEFRALAAERGFVVANSSTVYAQACAEHVFAFMLAQARKLPQGLASHAANGTPEWLALRNGSASLHGQSVLILGFGAIATQLVRMLAPFEMPIVALRRRPRGDEGVATVTPERLPAALATADHVLNILPDNAESQHFMNTERFAGMKRGAVFYNIGRGGTVDQDALHAALSSGHLEAAWLDVTEPEPLPADHPLRGLPNCFITPHTAGGHRNESEKLVRHFLENFRRFLDGTPLRDRIM